MMRSNNYNEDTFLSEYNKIINGGVKIIEISQASGVPYMTAKRYRKECPKVVMRKALLDAAKDIAKEKSDKYAKLAK